MKSIAAEEEYGSLTKWYSGQSVLKCLILILFQTLLGK